jgi:hypothetical protein
MMTITIDVPGAGDARKIASAVRQFKGVARVKVFPNTLLEPTPGVASTYAELIEELRRIEAAHDPVACIPHNEVFSDLEKRIAGWA